MGGHSGIMLDTLPIRPHATAASHRDEGGGCQIANACGQLDLVTLLAKNLICVGCQEML
jgi:hypothetical protein